ncbi:hypothetical protein IM792_10045 [Mucilaginibacter sp. JRF]|uniref:hypothetical protein n=1 Tax=Mucilaginibacter sp. JRF TaxID=2780088 RepID=UPI00187FE5CC|nr:hypothetical protein [Mucilaginibacter sp. JRF]MBE9584787.1 hypothetical protein [Mucilaginibacter sp. JRF]
MKSINNKPAASKLVSKFDNELRNMLMSDLQAFRAKNPKMGNNQGAVQQTLSAA